MPPVCESRAPHPQPRADPLANLRVWVQSTPARQPTHWQWEAGWNQDGAAWCVGFRTRCPLILECLSLRSQAWVWSLGWDTDDRDERKGEPCWNSRVWGHLDGRGAASAGGGGIRLSMLSVLSMGPGTQEASSERLPCTFHHSQIRTHFVYGKSGRRRRLAVEEIAKFQSRVRPAWGLSSCVNCPLYPRAAGSPASLWP